VKLAGQRPRCVQGVGMGDAHQYQQARVDSADDVIVNGDTGAGDPGRDGTHQEDGASRRRDPPGGWSDFAGCGTISP